MGSIFVTISHFHIALLKKKKKYLERKMLPAFVMIVLGSFYDILYFPLLRPSHLSTIPQVCVRAMAGLETVGPLREGIKVRPDMAGLACETLNRMFQRDQPELLAQVFVS